MLTGAITVHNPEPITQVSKQHSKFVKILKLIITPLRITENTDVTEGKSSDCEVAVV
jgi:hypothetical protein